MSPVGYIELREGTAQFKRISTLADVLALAAATALTALAAKRAFAG